jgi:hypothetical protein
MVLQNGISGAQVAPGASYLNVKRGQWILLSAQNTAWSDSLGVSIPLYLYRWYRIISADDVTNTTTAGVTTYSRNVTLAGPDWPLTTAGTTYATICDGVVAVFEKTMELERPSVWSSQ